MQDAFWGILIPFLGTSLGAGCVFFLKKSLSDGIQRALTGFAAGVMVAASVWSLLIPAMEQAADLGRLAFFPAAVGFWLGILFLLLLDHLIPHLHQNSLQAEGPKSQLQRTTMMVLAVTLHNIPEGMAVGVVYAVSLSTSADSMWQGFVGLFFMTAFVVLMIAFMASSITAMRQVQPIREMVQATRQYAEGDFDVRMKDYGRNDEMGELAASFNNMAETLQQTERQRREFIANISHELKTPMTTIAGYTDGILDGTIPPENERQYLQIISDESRRLSRLVRRMLDVSQLQVMDPLKNGSHFDICESMRRVLISMEKKITDRHLDVDADIPEEPILVRGDNDMITQVIYNLLENATKFAREGTTLYLGVTTIDGKARVTVRNLGDTIPAEELPLLFERFHKSDKSRSEDKDGYGLGLYIVKTILEQHKEKISVTSENGVTTFAFSLSMDA